MIYSQEFSAKLTKLFNVAECPNGPGDHIHAMRAKNRLDELLQEQHEDHHAAAIVFYVHDLLDLMERILEEDRQRRPGVRKSGHVTRNIKYARDAALKIAPKDYPAYARILTEDGFVFR